MAWMMLIISLKSFDEEDLVLRRPIAALNNFLKADQPLCMGVTFDQNSHYEISFTGFHWMAWIVYRR